MYRHPSQKSFLCYLTTLSRSSFFTYEMTQCNFPSASDTMIYTGYGQRKYCIKGFSSNIKCDVPITPSSTLRCVCIMTQLNFFKLLYVTNFNQTMQVKQILCEKSNLYYHTAQSLSNKATCNYGIIIKSKPL